MTFLLDTRDKLCDFDRTCMTACRSASVVIQDLPALRLLFDRLILENFQPRELWRQMALAYDIKVGYIQSVYELQTIAGLENRDWVTRQEPDKWINPLTNPKGLNISLARARAAFALVARIRAIWDKLFLFIAYKYDPECFRRMERSRRSHRKIFFNVFSKGIGPFTEDNLYKYKESIESLESSYRTPELHGFGAIRLWAFEPVGSWPVKGSVELIAHWNTLNEAIRLLFSAESTSACSIDEEEVWVSW
jgi:hypothetical protein